MPFKPARLRGPYVQTNQWRTAVFALLLVSLTLTALPADASTIAGVEFSADSVPVYNRLEVTFTIDAAYANPFDPDEVDVRALIETPGGITLTVFGFYYQPYTRELVDGREQLVAVSEPEWMVRFSPMEEGHYTLTLSVTDASGQSVTGPFDFNATSPLTSGFVRVDAQNPRYFSFDDGSQYIPLGANVCWAYDGGSFSTETWWQRMAAEGGNWSRLWMTETGPQILEWNENHWSGQFEGLGRYSLAMAWKFDEMLRIAEELGIYVQLVFHQASQFNTGTWSSWNDNPYNLSNGGPIATAMEFFTDETCSRLWDQKTRYILARYGAYRSVLAWELWNEVNGIGGYHPWIVNPWRLRKVALITAQDVYHHLVTDSSMEPYQFEPDHQSHTLDFYNRHEYLLGFTPGVWLLRKPWFANGRPVVMAEYGIDVNSQFDRQDTAGINWHNGIWAALLSGYAGGAMNWWWDTVLDPNDLWYLNAAPAAFVAADRMSDYHNVLHGIQLTTPNGSPLQVIGLLGNDSEPKAIFWVHDRRSNWLQAEPPAIKGAVATIDSLPGGVWRIEFWNTFNGEVTIETRELGQTFALQLPSFTRDIAIRARLQPPADDDDDDDDDNDDDGADDDVADDDQTDDDGGSSGGDDDDNGSGCGC